VVKSWSVVKFLSWIGYFKKKMEVELGVINNVSKDFDVPNMSGMNMSGMKVPRMGGPDPISRHTYQWRKNG